MIRGQRGHGLPDASPRLSCSSGGAGKSSKLMRLLQPCRSDVPMQSVPVSPPPMTTTCLPFAEMKPPPYLEVSPTSGVTSVVSSAGGLAKSAFWLRVRNSIAYTILSRSFGEIDEFTRREEELHRVDDPVEVAARDGEVVWHRRPDGEDGGVEPLHGLADGGGVDLCAGDEGDPLRLHQVHPALHSLLVELHVRDAVGEEPPRPLRPLKHGHRVPVLLVELVRRGEPGRARPNHGDLLARAARGRRRNHPPLGPRPLDDGVLHRLDRDALVDQAGDAGPLAGRRADAACELGEVVGRGEVGVGLPPLAVEDLLVELGDDVADRAARVRVAEGRAAVHAPRRLARELGLVCGPVDLCVVGEPVCCGPVWRRSLALDLDEASQLVQRGDRAVSPLDGGVAQQRAARGRAAVQQQSPRHGRRAQGGRHVCERGPRDEFWGLLGPCDEAL
mmetsp:Transcript_811/g.2763  ORF Transcript_811/g.2763 Transcript_811/m.2763 type:complete len:446 (-) Transcript_811:34-1371(-)